MFFTTTFRALTWLDWAVGIAFGAVLCMAYFAPEIIVAVLRDSPK